MVEPAKTRWHLPPCCIPSSCVPSCIHNHNRLHMTSPFSRHLVCSSHWDHTGQRRCHRAASSRYSCYSVPCMPWAWARPCQNSTTSSATSRCPGIPNAEPCMHVGPVAADAVASLGSRLAGPPLASRSACRCCHWSDVNPSYHAAAGCRHHEGRTCRAAYCCSEPAGAAPCCLLWPGSPCCCTWPASCCRRLCSACSHAWPSWPCTFGLMIKRCSCAEGVSRSLRAVGLVGHSCGRHAAGCLPAAASWWGTGLLLLLGLPPAVPPSLEAVLRRSVASKLTLRGHQGSRSMVTGGSQLLHQPLHWLAILHSAPQQIVQGCCSWC
jgi:hypothetical protein